MVKKDINFISAPTLAVRELGMMVRQTASLVSPGGAIKEKMANSWSADFSTRTIEWSPVGADGDFISHDAALRVIAHEAGHLEFTGKYIEPSEVRQAEKKQYFRWVNAIEDIRMERLVEKCFDGFRSLRLRDRQNIFMVLHAGKGSSYEPIDQACLGFMAMDVDFPLSQLRLAPEIEEIVVRRWEALENICNHAPSTDDLQRLAWPIYKEIVGSSNGGGSGSSETGDELDKSTEEVERLAVTSPFRSGAPEGEDNRPGSSANVHGGDRETISLEPNKDVNRGSSLVATHAGDDPAKAYGSRARSEWTDSYVRNRLLINSLAHQLRSVLRSNAQTRAQDGYRRGSLNTRRVHSSAYGNTRVFRQISAIEGKSYVFGVLIDTSASMEAMETARVSLIDPVVIVTEALEMAGISSFVIGWDGSIHIGKHVTQKLSDDRKGAMAKSFWPKGYTTYEAPALLAAEKQFRAGPQDATRVLITITDGATKNRSESKTLLRKMKEGMGVRDISIFVGSARSATNTSHHQTRLIVDDLAELSTELPKLLAEIVRRK